MIRTPHLFLFCFPITRITENKYWFSFEGRVRERERDRDYKHLFVNRIKIFLLSGICFQKFQPSYNWMPNTRNIFNQFTQAEHTEWTQDFWRLLANYKGDSKNYQKIFLSLSDSFCFVNFWDLFLFSILIKIDDIFVP